MLYSFPASSLRKTCFVHLIHSDVITSVTLSDVHRYPNFSFRSLNNRLKTMCSDTMNLFFLVKDQIFSLKFSK